MLPSIARCISLRLGLRDVLKSSRLSDVFVRVTRSPPASINDDFDEMDMETLIEECSKRSLSCEGVDENRLRRLLRAHDSTLEFEFGRTELVTTSIDIDFQQLVSIDIDEHLGFLHEVVVEVLGVLAQYKATIKAEEIKKPLSNSMCIDPTECVSLGMWKGTLMDVQSVKAKKMPVKAHVLTEFIPPSESPFHKRRPRTDLITPRDGKGVLSQKTCIIMFCSLDDGFLAASSLILKEIYDKPIKAKTFLPITTDIVISGMELTNFRLWEKGTPFLFVTYNKRRLWISKPVRTGLSSTTTHILPEIRIPLCHFLDIDGESSLTAIDAREVSVNDSLSSSSLTITVGIWFEATDSNELHVADVGVSELHLVDLLLLTDSTALMLSLSKCREGDPAPKCKLRLRGRQNLFVPQNSVSMNETFLNPVLPSPPLQLSSTLPVRSQSISSSHVTKPLLKRSQSFASPSLPILHAPSISPSRSLSDKSMSPSRLTSTDRKQSHLFIDTPNITEIDDNKKVPRTSVAKQLSLALDSPTSDRKETASNQVEKNVINDSAPKDIHELEMDRVKLMIDGLSALAIATSSNSTVLAKQPEDNGQKGIYKPIIDVKELYLHMSNATLLSSNVHSELAKSQTSQETAQILSRETTLGDVLTNSDSKSEQLNDDSIEPPIHSDNKIEQLNEQLNEISVSEPHDSSPIISSDSFSFSSETTVADYPLTYQKVESTAGLFYLPGDSAAVVDSSKELPIITTPFIEQPTPVSASDLRTMQEALAIMNNEDTAGTEEDSLLLSSMIPVSGRPLWRPNCLQLEPPPLEAVVAASLSFGEEPALALELALKNQILSELESDIDLVKKCLESASSEADMGTYVPDRLAEILESVSVAEIAIETQASIDSLSAVKIAHTSSSLIVGRSTAFEASADVTNVKQYASSSIDVASSLPSSSAAINEALKSDDAHCIARVASSVDMTRNVYASAVTSACTRDAQVERDGKLEWFAHRKAYRIAASVSREICEATNSFLEELRSFKLYCANAVTAYKEEVNSLKAQLFDIGSEIASREGLTLISEEEKRHRVGTITLPALLKLCEQEPVDKPGGQDLRLEVAIVAAKKEVIDMHAIIGQDRSARLRENIKREGYDLSTSQTHDNQEDEYNLLDTPTSSQTRDDKRYNVFSVEAERLQNQIDDLTVLITSIRRSISRSESLQQMRLAVSALWRNQEGYTSSSISSSDMNRFYIRALEQAPYSGFSFEAFELLRDKLEELKISHAQRRVQPTGTWNNKWAREELAYFSNSALASKRNFEKAVHQNLTAAVREKFQHQGKSEWDGIE
jgi:hypothetical protein